MSVKKHYQIDLGYDEQRNEWVSHTLSLVDHKVHVGVGTKLGPLFDRVKKIVRKKQRQAEKFPLPEESSIITLPSKMILPPKLIIPNGS